jgi:hypothetical protein
VDNFNFKISRTPGGHQVKWKVPHHLPQSGACVEAEMDDARGPFNNSDNSKFCDDTIPFSHSVHLDRLQFSLDSRYAGTVLGHLKSLFGHASTKRDGKKFIYRFRHAHGLVEFVKWYEGCFYWGINVHDPDAEVQESMAAIMKSCPMRLKIKEVEVALDFHPYDRYDLHALHGVLMDGLVVKHSRAGCYREIHGTIYIGKDGNVRKAPRAPGYTKSR